MSPLTLIRTPHFSSRAPFPRRDRIPSEGNAAPSPLVLSFEEFRRIRSNATVRSKSAAQRERRRAKEVCSLTLLAGEVPFPLFSLVSPPPSFPSLLFPILLVQEDERLAQESAARKAAMAGLEKERSARVVGRAPLSPPQPSSASARRL